MNTKTQLTKNILITLRDFSHTFRDLIKIVKIIIQQKINRQQ